MRRSAWIAFTEATVDQRHPNGAGSQQQLARADTFASSEPALARSEIAGRGRRGARRRHHAPGNWLASVRMVAAPVQFRRLSGIRFTIRYIPTPRGRAQPEQDQRVRCSSSSTTSTAGAERHHGRSSTRRVPAHESIARSATILPRRRIGALHSAPRMRTIDIHAHLVPRSLWKADGEEHDLVRLSARAGRGPRLLRGRRQAHRPSPRPRCASRPKSG